MPIKNNTNLHKVQSRGFTLIEMMVAVALFSIAMMVGTGALLTLVDQNKQARALNSVIRDLNFSLESMVRTIRTGEEYGCDGVTGRDCEGGGTQLILRDQNGQTIRYRFQTTAGVGRIERRVGNGSYVALTSENVDIEYFRVYVSGAGSLSDTGDTQQPRVLITISGVSRTEASESTSFDIQTTVTQRAIDI